MKTYTLEREQMIPRSRSETFAFFGDAFNLERITPPFLRFRILTEPPIAMKAGTIIEYRLQLFGIGFGWRTLIEEWSPEHSFVDRQIDGPYALWHHTHTFQEIGSCTTLMRDRVMYRIPYGLIGRMANMLFVKKSLDNIFDYRARMTAKLLAPENELSLNNPTLGGETFSGSEGRA
jgi:ligand-binding SRPBCC domain-containing protein